jgi:Cytochrome c oxidase subunit IV
MSAMSAVCLGLAAFLAVAGAIYGVTSHELAGTTQLLVSATTFLVLSVVTRFVARGIVDEREPDEEHEGLVHVGPTIWPFAFAVSGVVLALGLIVTGWILIPGAIAFAASAAGWLRDVARSHADTET